LASLRMALACHKVQSMRQERPCRSETDLHSRFRAINPLLPHRVDHAAEAAGCSICLASGQHDPPCHRWLIPTGQHRPPRTGNSASQHGPHSGEILSHAVRPVSLAKDAEQSDPSFSRIGNRGNAGL
jgi:hypothetical protein